MKINRNQLPSNAAELVRLALAEAARVIDGEGLRDCVRRQFAQTALANASAGGLPGCTHGRLGDRRASLMLGMTGAHPSSDLRTHRSGHWSKAVRFGAKLTATWETIEIARDEKGLAL